MKNNLSLITLLVTVLLAAGFLFLFYSQKELSSRINSLTNDPKKTVVEKDANQIIDECGDNCRKTIEEEISAAIATISAVTKYSTPVITTPTNKNTTYITLNGPVTTTSTQWVEIPGVEVYIDLAGDYGKGATASWEATLKVAHGNGQAYARILDVTHGTAVDGSELSTTNNPNYSLVTSGNISLWAGRNLYRLQLKSLNSFEVAFLSGRIKITY